MSDDIDRAGGSSRALAWWDRHPARSVSEEPRA